MGESAIPTRAISSPPRGLVLVATDASLSTRVIPACETLSPVAPFDLLVLRLLAVLLSIGVAGLVAGVDILLTNLLFLAASVD